MNQAAEQRNRRVHSQVAQPQVGRRAISTVATTNTPSKLDRTTTLLMLATLGLVLFQLLAPARAFSEETKAGPVYTSLFSNVAVGGYDPVAYFTEGKAVEGSSDFETEYRGTTWRFSNQTNLDSFEEDPTKYSPQYGGYCAWAVANGDTAAGKPEFWKIVDGKLYLNYSAKVQSKWEKDIPGFIVKADKNWPAVAQ